MPNGWRTIKSLVHKIRLHGRRGKGMAESFSREKLRYAPQKEGGWEILCDLPLVWPRLVCPTNLMSRMNGKKTHTHTPRTTMVLLIFFWCFCMAISLSVQYNGGLLPDIILLTQRYYHGATRLNVMKMFLKKNQSTPRPSEHPPVMGGEMSKRLGGIKGCKINTKPLHGI